MAIEVLYHGNCFHEHKNPDIIDICIKKETSHSTSIFPFVKFMFLVSRYKKFFY